MKQMKQSFTTFSALAMALTCAAFVSAATVTVTNTNDSGAGSLRQALGNADDGDTIDFDSSLNRRTITLTSGELLVDKSVTISGLGPNNLVVDGNLDSRVLHIIGGVTATISDLTITNGSAYGDFGGGIYNDHSTLTVSNCTLSGNSASTGGFGGGIVNDGSSSGSATLTVTNSTLSGNSASYAGGIFNNGLSGSATLTVTNSTLSGNLASDAGFGGGIVNDGGSSGSATLTVTNSTLSGNSASYVGGILNNGLSGTAVLTVTNSTLSGNSATTYGGILNDGRFSGSATVHIGGTILNAGASGANIYQLAGTINSLGYNLSSDDASSCLIGRTDQNSTDPRLGPLANNGGPTLTHALLSGSPAIDTGDPNLAPPPYYDQRGPGYDRVANSRIDIGAFEVQTATPSYAAQIRPPINADGTSIFSTRRGVVPVKFTLTQGGLATCDLPSATIAVTRTAGGVTGEVNESLYSGNADTGSNFRIDNCGYVYNLNSRALGVGTYRVDILINGHVVGSAVFQLE